MVAVDGSDAAWAARVAARFGDVRIELLSIQPPFSALERMLDVAAGRFAGHRLGEQGCAGARRAGAARVERSV